MEVERRLTFEPKFVKGESSLRFDNFIKHFEQNRDGELGIFYGVAGYGKTTHAIHYAAHHGQIYLRMYKVWRVSEAGFLRQLHLELGGIKPPRQKGECFAEVLDLLLADPKIIFIDEIEKLPNFFIEVVRDIADVTGAPFVLIGEDEILNYMKRNKRVWSRTSQVLKIDPMSKSDVFVFIAETTGVEAPPDVVAVLHEKSTGEVRLLKRFVKALVRIANARGETGFNADMAAIATKTGLLVPTKKAGGKQ